MIFQILCIYVNLLMEEDWFDYILENPDKPWNYGFLSMNPNITWDIVLANPDFPWDYADI